MLLKMRIQNAFLFHSKSLSLRTPHSDRQTTVLATTMTPRRRRVVEKDDPRVIVASGCAIIFGVWKVGLAKSEQY